MMPAAPTDFFQFMQQQAQAGRPVTAKHTLRGAAAWQVRRLDALLTLGAASTIVYLACRGPYCSTCRSWYRIVRAGPDSAGQASQIAEAAGMPVKETSAAGRYRLSHCMGGCGPSRLELAGEGGADQSYYRLAFGRWARASCAVIG